MAVPPPLLAGSTLRTRHPTTRAGVLSNSCVTRQPLTSKHSRVCCTRHTPHANTGSARVCASTVGILPSHARNGGTRLPTQLSLQEQARVRRWIDQRLGRLLGARASCVGTPILPASSASVTAGLACLWTTWCRRAGRATEERASRETASTECTWRVHTESLW